MAGAIIRRGAGHLSTKFKSTYGHLSTGFFNLPIFSITHFSNAVSAIIKLCSDKGHKFEPNVHNDFEKKSLDSNETILPVNYGQML